MKLNFIDNLNIYLEIFMLPDHDMDMLETINPESDFDKIKKDVSEIIMSFGYTELEKADISKHGSMYFIFCKKNEYDTNEVTLITKMRVSDHILPLRDDDKTQQDAINRQIRNFQLYANDNKWLNKNFGDSDEMPATCIYVKYENAFYTELEDLYSKIRKRLEVFANKHK